MTAKSTTKVLIVAATVPAQQATIVERLEQLRDAGAEVSIACNFDPELLPIDDDLAVRYVLPSLSGRYERRVKRALGAASRTQRVWLHVQRNPDVRRKAREADVIVALDPTATHAVWELAQRHRRPAAVYGMTPALRAVARHQANPDFASRGVLPSAAALGGVAYRGTRQSALITAANVARAAVSPSVMRTGLGARFWSATVALPRVPDGVRRRIAYAVHVNLLRADRPSTAISTSAVAAKRIVDGSVRADLLVREALAEAKYGQPGSMRAAVGASLDLCDSFLQRKEPRKVAPVLYRGMRLLFHPPLHRDRLTSALADDPEGYLAEWRRSTAVRALIAPQGRALPAATAPSGRPLRLLIAADSRNDLDGEPDGGRINDITRRFENLAGVEARFIDFAEHEELGQLALGAKQIIDHVIAGQSIYGNRIESLLRPHLDWADTVLIEGAQAPAAMFTLVDPGETRVIVRLRGVDTYGYWPHLIDFSRVNDLVFEADHVKDFAIELMPHLAGAEAPRLHTIAGAMKPRGPVQPKSDAARFTLAMVGVGAIAKDPRWGVEVLRRLRERDARYQLLLVGEWLNTERSHINAYDELLSQDIVAIEGAIHRRPHTGDIGQLLADVGVIVNGSVRESFPYPVVDAAASGAIPIVRDWPFFAARAQGAHTLLPTEWVVDTPDQAAERILKLTSSEDTWRDAGRAASELANESWDASTAIRDFDNLVIGLSE